MVRLGLIQSPDQAPKGCHRVFFRRSPAGKNKRRTKLFTTTFGHHSRWELSIPIDPAEVEEPDWSAPMARILSDLDWTSWWLDVESLSGITGLTPGYILKSWGRGFWPLYNKSGVVYFLTGWHRREIENRMHHWAASYATLTVSQEHDLETRAMEAAAKKRAWAPGALWRRLREH